MLRRLSVSRRSSCTDIQESRSSGSTIRDGCPEFVSWDSDVFADGMSDYDEPPSPSSQIVWPVRTSSRDTMTERRESRKLVRMGSVAEDDAFQLEQMPRQGNGVRSVGIAFASEKENEDVLADIMMESLVDARSPKNQDIWAKKPKQKKGRRKSLKRLSLNANPFKKKKHDKLRASYLV